MERIRKDLLVMKKRKDSKSPLWKFLESETEGEPSGSMEPIGVKRRDLTRSEEVEEVVRIVQAGDIVVLDITPLIDEDPETLRNSVGRLKGEITEFGGSIARVSGSLIMIVPRFVDFEFRKKGQSGE